MHPDGFGDQAFILFGLALAGFFSLLIAAVTGRYPWEHDERESAHD